MNINGQRVKLGEVAVDSGQLILTDPCYLKEFDSKDDDFGTPGPDGKYPPVNRYGYAGACVATLNGPGGNVGTFEGQAVAFGTGWGDGCYQVHAVVRNGRVMSVTVCFDHQANRYGECDSCGADADVEDLCSDCGGNVDDGRCTCDDSGRCPECGSEDGECSISCDYDETEGEGA